MNNNLFILIIFYINRYLRIYPPFIFNTLFLKHFNILYNLYDITETMGDDVYLKRR
jgi:peptidoglycan/LPS O-acetylase OafA/YrhL